MWQTILFPQLLHISVNYLSPRVFRGAANIVPGGRPAEQREDVSFGAP